MDKRPQEEYGHFPMKALVSHGRRRLVFPFGILTVLSLIALHYVQNKKITIRRNEVMIKYALKNIKHHR